MKLTSFRCLGVVLLTFALGVFAPAALAQEDEARAVIARAFALLDESHYAYMLSFETIQTLTDTAGDEYGTRQAYEIDGTANGTDFQDTIRLTVTPLEYEDDAQSTVLERIHVDDTLYVQLDDLLAAQFDVEAGWWSFDGLLDAIGSDSVRRAGTEQIVQIPRPLTLVVADDLITNVTELEAEEVDGEAVRVFDIELNALDMALAQAGGAAAEQLAANARLISQSELTANIRLRIADDGRLVSGESSTRTYLPFIAYGDVDDPDFDFDLHQTLQFALSAVDDRADIEPPPVTVD